MALNDTHCKRDDKNSFTATIKLTYSQFLRSVSQLTSGSPQTASAHRRKGGTILWCWPSTTPNITHISSDQSEMRIPGVIRVPSINIWIWESLLAWKLIPLCLPFCGEKDAQYNYCSKLPFRAQARPVSIWWSLTVRGWIRLLAGFPVNPCGTQHWGDKRPMASALRRVAALPARTPST